MKVRIISLLQSCLSSVASGLYMLAVTAESIRDGLDIAKARIGGDFRSPQQYFNMFFDWVDIDELATYYERFANLVVNGINPEHAFKIVTNRGNKTARNEN